MTSRSQLSDPEGRHLGVVLIEPVPEVLDKIRGVLDKHPDFEVLLEAFTADQALGEMRQLRHRLGVVAVVSMTLSGEHDAVWLIRAIRRNYPTFPVIACGLTTDADTISYALFAGADGFVGLGVRASRFVETLRRAASRGTEEGAAREGPLIVVPGEEPEPSPDEFQAEQAEYGPSVQGREPTEAAPAPPTRADEGKKQGRLSKLFGGRKRQPEAPPETPQVGRPAPSPAHRPAGPDARRAPEAPARPSVPEREAPAPSDAAEVAAPAEEAPVEAAPGLEADVLPEETRQPEVEAVEHEVTIEVPTKPASEPQVVIEVPEAPDEAAREAEERAAKEAQERAAKEAGERAAKEAEERAAREAEERAAREAEERAAREAEEAAAREAEERAAKEAEEQAAKEAEERAAKEAEERAAKEAEEQAAKEAEERAAREAEEAAAREAEERAAKEAEEQAAKEAEERAAREAEERAAREAEEAAAREAEERAAREAEERARILADEPVEEEPDLLVEPGREPQPPEAEAARQALEQLLGNIAAVPQAEGAEEAVRGSAEPIQRPGGTELRTVTVGPPQEFQELVASALGDELPDVEWVPSVTKAEEMLIGSGPRIDILVVAPMVKEPEAFGLADVAMRTSPATTIIFAREGDRDRIASRAMRAGVRDVVELSLGAEELQEALQRAREWSLSMRFARGEARADEGPLGQVISIFASKGGTGKTFLAANLGVAMADRSGDDVALFDLDFVMGDLFAYFGQEPDRSVEQLIEIADLTDPSDIRSAGTKLSDHVWGFAARPQLEASPSAHDIARLLRALRTAFSHVVVDASTDYSDRALAVFDISDAICLVTGLDIVGARHLSIDMETLRRLHLAREKVRVILNRADAKVGLDQGAVERALKIEVDAAIPSSSLVPTSVNRGRILYLDEPDSSVAKRLAAFADKLLAGDEELAKRRKRFKLL